MKLKNAGITSKKECATRMLNGEVFYYNDKKIYFDESKLHPFRVCEVKTERISDALGGLWDYFPEFKIEYRWEYELENGPVLCWVSDENPDDKCLSDLINDKDFSDPSSKYETCDGFEWVYATPVQPSECLNLED